MKAFVDKIRGRVLFAAPDEDRRVFSGERRCEVGAGAADPVVDRRDGDALAGGGCWGTLLSR